MADQNMSGEIIQHTPKDAAVINTGRTGANMDLPPLPSADPKIRFIEESSRLETHDPDALRSLRTLLKDYTVEGATPEERGIKPDTEAIQKATAELPYPTDPSEKRVLEIAIGAASGFYKFQTPEDTATANRILDMLRDPGKRAEGMKELDKALEAKKSKKDS